MQSKDALFHRWIPACALVAMAGGAAMASGHWLIGPLGYLVVVGALIGMALWAVKNFSPPQVE